MGFVNDGACCVWGVCLVDCMIYLLALLFIVMVSLLVVRVGTNALVLTGMSEEAARFQAASAFFGVGFTTSEAEMVMRNTVRRRIVLHLIVAGNVGLTSAMATLIVTVIQGGSEDGLGLGELILILVLGVVGMAILFNAGWIRRPIDRVMKATLRSAGVVRAMDYETLLQVDKGFGVSEVKLEAGHPWAGKLLKESRPSDGGVVVLNVRKVGGEFVGAPDKDFLLEVGDEMMVYGADDCVERVAKWSLDAVGED